MSSSHELLMGRHYAFPFPPRKMSLGKTAIYPLFLLFGWHISCCIPLRLVFKAKLFSSSQGIHTNSAVNVNAARVFTYWHCRQRRTLADLKWCFQCRWKMQLCLQDTISGSCWHLYPNLPRPCISEVCQGHRLHRGSSQHLYGMCAWARNKDIPSHPLCLCILWVWPAWCRPGLWIQEW